MFHFLRIASPNTNYIKFQCRKVHRGIFPIKLVGLFCIAAYLRKIALMLIYNKLNALSFKYQPDLQ